MASTPDVGNVEIDDSFYSSAHCAEWLRELNERVAVDHINLSPSIFEGDSQLESLLQSFDCVIFASSSVRIVWSSLHKINQLCRLKNPAIPFVVCRSVGLAGYIFVDFGPLFTVTDVNGRANNDVFIGDISNESPHGVVTTLDQEPHGLSSGDHVTFKNLKGIVELNGRTQTVDVLDAYRFKICDTSQMGKYSGDGVVKRVKVPIEMCFESLGLQVKCPCVIECTLGIPNRDFLLCCCLITWDSFESPASDTSEDEFVNLVADMINRQVLPFTPQFERTVRLFYSTMAPFLSAPSASVTPFYSPLASALGGWAAQECLKALTGKFVPLKQDAKNCVGVDDRCSGLRLLLGDDFVQRLRDLKLFMVGCGAIGCELLKIFALSSVSTRNGRLCTADDDLIEKSNLNRQFLFRPRHVQQAKCIVAKQAAQIINPDMKVDAFQMKVCPETESSNFNDEFMSRLDVAVSALDSVAARRYLDSRCVANKKAMVDCGTLGAVGHSQVCVPYVTESWGCWNDLPDEDVTAQAPMCTIKSFPVRPEHAVQWARNKFESLFVVAPAAFNQFWAANGPPDDLAQRVTSVEGAPDDIHRPVKLSKMRPKDQNDCIVLARDYFEKRFNHAPKKLLCIFPKDTKLADGGDFWRPPKNPPVAIEFNINDSEHLLFIVAAARLYATMYGVCCDNLACPADARFAVERSLLDYTPPEFHPPKPSKSAIEHYMGSEAQTLDLASAAGTDGSRDDDSMSKTELAVRWLSQNAAVVETTALQQLTFDKDNELHTDFIAAATYLRCGVYSLPTCSRWEAKRISGNIVPAIASTTALVAGLAAMALFRYAAAACAESGRQLKVEHLRHAFVNLEIPSCIFTEPAPPKRKTVVSYKGAVHSATVWDRFEVPLQRDATLRSLCAALRERFGAPANVITCGSRTVYMGFYPGHSTRLDKKLV